MQAAAHRHCMYVSRKSTLNSQVFLGWDNIQCHVVPISKEWSSTWSCLLHYSQYWRSKPTNLTGARFLNKINLYPTPSPLALERQCKCTHSMTELHTLQGKYMLYVHNLAMFHAAVLYWLNHFASCPALLWLHECDSCIHSTLLRLKHVLYMSTNNSACTHTH